MNSAVHSRYMTSKILRDSALPDFNRGSLEYMPRQHGVNAAIRHRQPFIKQNRVRYPAVFFDLALFGFCEQFLFGFYEHVLETSYTAGVWCFAPKTREAPMLDSYYPRHTEYLVPPVSVWVSRPSLLSNSE